MNDGFRVHVLDSSCYLSHYHWCGLFRKWTIFLKKLVELSIWCQLLEEIDVVFIAEKIIELY